MCLLHRLRTEEAEAGGAASHNVGVLSVNAKRLTRDRTGRDVEDARKHFSRNLVHVGNHQQKTLRARERGAQTTANQRTVHGAGGTRLGLHLDHGTTK